MTITNDETIGNWSPKPDPPYELHWPETKQRDITEEDLWSGHWGIIRSGLGDPPISLGHIRSGATLDEETIRCEWYWRLAEQRFHPYTLYPYQYEVYSCSIRLKRAGKPLTSRSGC